MRHVGLFASLFVALAIVADGAGAAPIGDSGLCLLDPDRNVADVILNDGAKAMSGRVTDFVAAFVVCTRLPAYRANNDMETDDWGVVFNIPSAAGRAGTCGGAVRATSVAEIDRDYLDRATWRGDVGAPGQIQLAGLCIVVAVYGAPGRLDQYSMTAHLTGPNDALGIEYVHTFEGIEDMRAEARRIAALAKWLADGGLAQ